MPQEVMLCLDHIPVAFCHLAKLHSKLTIKIFCHKMAVTNDRNVLISL